MHGAKSDPDDLVWWMEGLTTKVVDERADNQSYWSERLNGGLPHLRHHIMTPDTLTRLTIHLNQCLALPAQVWGQI